MNIKKMKFKNDFIIYYKGNKPPQELIDKTIFYLRNPSLKDSELVKKGNGRKIFKASVASKSYYFKKYSYRSFDKKLKNLIRKSAAYRSFKKSHLLLDKKIPVVEPVLAVLYKHNFFTYDSVFVTEDFNGINFQEFIAFEEYNNKLKKKLIKKAALFWSELYKNNIINNDPNLGSILINSDNSSELSLVDVDNIKIKDSLTSNEILHNLSKFNAHSYLGLKKLGGKQLSCSDKKIFLEEIYNNMECFSHFKFRNLFSLIVDETCRILDLWN